MQREVFACARMKWRILPITLVALAATTITGFGADWGKPTASTEYDNHTEFDEAVDEFVEDYGLPDKDHTERDFNNNSECNDSTHSDRLDVFCRSSYISFRFVHKKVDYIVIHDGHCREEREKITKIWNFPTDGCAISNPHVNDEENDQPNF